MLRLFAPDSPLLGDSLLGRCADGDELSWRSLYASHEATVRNFLRRLGVSPEALDDAAQEVFLEAFRYLPRFRGESSFKTWLYRLCLTQARKEGRRRRIKEVVRTLLAFQGPDEADYAPLEASSATRSVERALSSLSEGERAVFVLYELEGVSGKEIAELLDCPEATVWRRLHYGRRKFEASIRDEEMLS